MCSPGEEDGGNEDYGAMVFPEGDEEEDNSTDTDTNDTETPEVPTGRRWSMRKTEFWVGGENRTWAQEGRTKVEGRKRALVGPSRKRDVPTDGVDPGGQCPLNRFNTWITLLRGTFAANGM
jgi:hypothetical protein